VERLEDVVIVGAGPIGLACAISARRRALDPLVIDQGSICHSIVRYPIGMTFFTTPERLEIGGHPFACSGQKPTREEALMYYRGVVRAEGLRVRTYTRLVTASRMEEHIACGIETRLGSEKIWCHRLILATGYYDNPNPIGVEGEDQPHVSHYFDEAHRSCGQRVVVIGAKNSAVEAALELYRAGAHVTLISRHTAFRPTVKYWLVPDIRNRIAAGEIDARFGVEVVRIGRTGVTVRGADGESEEIPCDRVYALTGFRPDFELFEEIGITLDPESRAPAIDVASLETNVPGVFMAGSITHGRRISEVFIENGRFDGEKIFADVVNPPLTAYSVKLSS
jgi:thioredoxin reductase (NADPH)